MKKSLLFLLAAGLLCLASCTSGEEVNPDLNGEAGVSDARNTMAHLQIIKSEDIQKMADNNIIPVCAPLWAPIDPEYNKHEVAYLGQERVDSEYRVKSFFDAGCKVNFHSDYPVSPSISIPLTVYTAVKRTSRRMA